MALQEYMAKHGSGQSTPESGRSYLAGARESAMQAAEKRTEAAVAGLEAQRPEIERRYDALARQNYQGYMQSRSGLANSLASQGLYNSGYSDSAQVAQTTSYRERGNENEQERERALRELETQIALARMEGSANLSELEAQYLSLMQEQWNADRAYNYQKDRDAVADTHWAKEMEYQKGRDAVADTQWEKKMEYQKDRDAVADMQWEKKMEYQKGRDAVADTQWEKEFVATQEMVELEKEMWLKEAESEEEQRAIENAYMFGMAGDMSRLKALNIDTSYLEKLLELEMQQMYRSVYGSGGSGGSSYTGGGSNRGGSGNGGVYTEELDAVKRREVEMEAAGLIDTYHRHGNTERELLSYIGGDSAKQMYTNKYGAEGYEYLTELIVSGYSAYQPNYTMDYDTAKASVDRMLKRIDQIYESNEPDLYGAADTVADAVALQRKEIAKAIAEYDISNADKTKLISYAGVTNEWREMSK